MSDGSRPPYKKSTLHQELLNLCRPDGETFIRGSHFVMRGRHAGKLILLFKNDDLNCDYVNNFHDRFAAHFYHYMKSCLGYSQCCVDKFMNAFCDSNRFTAPDET